MTKAKLPDHTLMDKPVKVRYRDRMEQDGHETWHDGSVSFSSLREALQAIEAEGANISVDYVMLMTIEGELLLGHEDVKRLQCIGRRKHSSLG